MNLLRSTALAAGALLLGGCGLDVMYADWRVDRLCKQDGGVKVFETDQLPAELRQADGNVDLWALQRAKEGDPFFLVNDSTRIMAAGIEIKRLKTQLFRGRDGKLMGSSVVYVRPMQSIGVPFFHRDAHSCPSVRDIYILTAGVFFPNSVPR